MCTIICVRVEVWIQTVNKIYTFSFAKKHMHTIFCTQGGVGIRENTIEDIKGKKISPVSSVSFRHKNSIGEFWREKEKSDKYVNRKRDKSLRIIL